MWNKELPPGAGRQLPRWWRTVGGIWAVQRMTVPLVALQVQWGNALRSGIAADDSLSRTWQVEQVGDRGNWTYGPCLGLSGRFPGQLTLRVGSTGRTFIREGSQDRHPGKGLGGGGLDSLNKDLSLPPPQEALKLREPKELFQGGVRRLDLYAPAWTRPWKCPRRGREPGPGMGWGATGVMHLYLEAFSSLYIPPFSQPFPSPKWI